MAAVQPRFDMGETPVASGSSTSVSSGLTCDAICGAVLPCVTLVRLLECVKICSRIPVHSDLDNTHVKHLAAVFLSLEMNSSSYSSPFPSTSSSTSPTTAQVATCGGRVDVILMKTKQATVGEKRIYSCPYGFDFCKRTVKTPMIYCKSDGRWSNPPVPCHQNRWGGSVSGQNVSLQFTCSVKKDTAIFIKAHLRTVEGKVYVTLRGPVGILEHTFIVQSQVPTILQIEYKAFGEKWKKYQKRKERLRFGKTEITHFYLNLRHKGSFIQVRMNGENITSYAIPPNMAITQLLITGQLWIKNVKIYRF